MNKISVSIVKGLILISQLTPFRGRGGYGCTVTAVNDDTKRFPQAEIEAADVNAIECCFESLNLDKFLRGKEVLDLGSGYGGRTVEYAKYAEKIIGIEPFENMIESSIEYAMSKGAENCIFKLCSETIPIEASSVDVVICYDVLEHVQNPIDTMSEIYRVLRPGGKAVIVFPPYFGAFSHHLDYISLLPALQWMFSPFTLITAVNEILEIQYGKKFGTASQPLPQKGYMQDRYVLPTLNGLTSEGFRQICHKFCIQEMHEDICFSRKFPALGKLLYLFSKLFKGHYRELFFFKVGTILRKPQL